MILYNFYIYFVKFFNFYVIDYLIKHVFKYIQICLRYNKQSKIFYYILKFKIIVLFTT